MKIKHAKKHRIEEHKRKEKQVEKREKREKRRKVKRNTQVFFAVQFPFW